MSAARPPQPPASPGGFELEDASEPSAPKPSLPATAPASTPRPSPRSGGEAANVRSEGPKAPSDLTFAEKHGQAVERVAGVRDLPPGWPREALAYPWRGAGTGYLLGATGALFALDLLGWPPGLRFLAWLVKAPALLFVLRWQLDLAGMSAAGRDAPVGFTRALGVDRAGLAVFARFLLWCFVLLLPSRLLWLLGPDMLGFVSGTAAWEVGLAIVGSAWMAVVALATAVEEPRLKRPWVTVVWLVRRPFHLGAASLGWWGLGATEVAMHALAGSGAGATIPAGVVLRAASVYLLMLSARVLGVLGRRVDPDRIGPA